MLAQIIAKKRSLRKFENAMCIDATLSSIERRQFRSVVRHAEEVYAFESSTASIKELVSVLTNGSVLGPRRLESKNATQIRVLYTNGRLATSGPARNHVMVEREREMCTVSRKSRKSEFVHRFALAVNRTIVSHVRILLAVGKLNQSK